MRQVTRKQSAFEVSYRKSFMKLLTVAANAPKAVDEYFFGQADDREEESEEVRPYFYGSISFGIAVLLFCYVVISG